MMGSREEKADSASSGEDEESLRELVSFDKVRTLNTAVIGICELFSQMWPGLVANSRWGCVLF